jgi:hypothetical protein
MDWRILVNFIPRIVDIKINVREYSVSLDCPFLAPIKNGQSREIDNIGYPNEEKQNKNTTQ